MEVAAAVGMAVEMTTAVVSAEVGMTMTTMAVETEVEVEVEVVVRVYMISIKMLSRRCTRLKVMHAKLSRSSAPRAAL